MMDFEDEARNITLLNSILQTDCVKIVVIGGTSVGKTCMIMSYTTDSFPENSVPTIFDSYT
jgi:GTPase SAR1 family protein